jgi:hypothetical protein
MSGAAVANKNQSAPALTTATAGFLYEVVNNITITPADPNFDAVVAAIQAAKAELVAHLTAAQPEPEPSSRPPSQVA